MRRMPQRAPAMTKGHNVWRPCDTATRNETASNGKKKLFRSLWDEVARGRRVSCVVKNGLTDKRSHNTSHAGDTFSSVSTSEPIHMASTSSSSPPHRPGAPTMGESKQKKRHCIAYVINLLQRRGHRCSAMALSMHAMARQPRGVCARTQVHKPTQNFFQLNDTLSGSNGRDRGTASARLVHRRCRSLTSPPLNPRPSPFRSQTGPLPRAIPRPATESTTHCAAHEEMWVGIQCTLAYTPRVPRGGRGPCRSRGVGHS